MIDEIENDSQASGAAYDAPMTEVQRSVMQWQQQQRLSLQQREESKAPVNVSLARQNSVKKKKTKKRKKLIPLHSETDESVQLTYRGGTLRQGNPTLQGKNQAIEADGPSFPERKLGSGKFGSWVDLSVSNQSYLM